MRNESGMAVIVVMGLLVVVSLIGIGMIAQTVTNTKFFEAMGTSYIGLTEAQKNLATKAPVTGLVMAQGKRPRDGILASVIFAVPPPPTGGSSNGVLTGNVWRPGLCGTFYDHFTGKGSVISDGVTIHNSYYNPAKKGLDESAFLFRDGAGTNGADVLTSWNSYNTHVEFNADVSPAFGVYFNAGSTGKQSEKGITGYLFQMSPKDNTFSIVEVHNGTPNPGSSLQSKSFSDSSIKDADGNNPFKSWMNGSSAGTGGPFDQWHSVDISVQSQGAKTPATTTVSINGVQIFNYTDTKGSQFGPGTVGLSNWSGDGWGTYLMPSSVVFRNVMVTNTSQ